MPLGMQQVALVWPERIGAGVSVQNLPRTGTDEVSLAAIEQTCEGPAAVVGIDLRARLDEAILQADVEVIGDAHLGPGVGEVAVLADGNRAAALGLLRAGTDRSF